MKPGTRLKTLGGENWHVTRVEGDYFTLKREDGYEADYSSAELQMMFIRPIPKEAEICDELFGDMA